MFYLLDRIAKRSRWNGTAMLALLALALACNGGQEEPEETPLDPATMGRTKLTVEELPPMPSYPTASSGRLVTQSAGDYEINGAWSTTAEMCEHTSVVEIYAGPSGFGTAILLQLPDEDRVGEYPVVAASANPPDAPAALIAVQVFNEPDAYGFQAYDGVLELTEFGERLSGRFTSTLREINIDILTHFVGVFENIPVTPMASDYCQGLEDSTSTTDSTSDEG